MQLDIVRVDKREIMFRVEDTVTGATVAWRRISARATRAEYRAAHEWVRILRRAL